MIHPVLMCKTHSKMRECRGYWLHLCDTCPKRDVLLARCCDCCEEELDEDNPAFETDGREVCGRCLSARQEKRGENNE